MGKNLICQLDVTTREKGSTERERVGYLEKVIDEEMLDGTFQNLIDYMLDTELDDLNIEPYKEIQIGLVKEIKHWYDEISQDRGGIDIYSPDNDNPTELFGPYDPRHNISDYAREVIKTKDEIVEGETVSVPTVDLLVEYIPPGGN